jgi:hypothetical protein
MSMTVRITRIALLFAALLVATLTPARGLAAQKPAAIRMPPVVTYGKWALLAGSAGLNLLALHNHHLADDTFSQLADICTAAEHSRCLTGQGGAYLDPGAEAIYQNALSADRRARAWLIAGETVLLGSAAMFVWELSRPRGRESNIPFTPRVGLLGNRTTVGLSIPF